jgi:tRNA(Ile)-lysidine synthetase-like protein
MSGVQGPPAGVVIAAISGGPDSTALLLFLSLFSHELNYRCEAAYFDHQIRDQQERGAEMAIVCRLAESLAIPLHLGNAPVPELARARHHSLEEEARTQRYAFLADTARKQGAQYVAVGHTADDQVETILLHLLHGTGLLGLVGMRPRGDWPFGSGPALIRPLLDFTRAETAGYIRSRGVLAHEDSENASPLHTRNRVRHELLPLLESFNPNVRSALLRLGRSAAVQGDLLAQLVAQAQERARVNTSKGSALLVSVLRPLPEAVRFELFARAFTAARGSRIGLTSRHFRAVESLLLLTGEHSLDLPSGVRAHLSAGLLRFETLPATEQRVLQSQQELTAPGEIRFGPWLLRVQLLAPGEVGEPAPMMAVISERDVAAGLTVRRRRPGDRMQLDGSRGSKKLQDLLVDAKVPRSERDTLPVCCLGAEVIWVPGVRAEARARQRDSSLPRMLVTASRLDDDLSGGLGLSQATE